jgi:hypothetical protein
MAEKKVLHKRPVFYILSGVLVILCTAGFFFWRNYKYKLVNRKLDNLVTGKSKGLYQISYNNLVINEALGNISAENIEMVPDSSVYQTLLEQHTQPKNLFYIKIPKLTISGVKTPKALLNKEISSHIIRLENAEIEVRLGKDNKEKKSVVQPDLAAEIYRQLLGNLKSVKADSVLLENATLTLVDRETKITRCKAKGLSLLFSGIEIDSLTQNDSSKILFSRDLSIHCNQILLPLTNGIYHLQVSGLNFSSHTGLIHTDQVRLKNRMSETAFAKSHKYAIDRFDLEMTSLDLGHISRSGLFRQHLEADSLLMTGLSLRVFRDNSYPHDSIDRTHQFPQEAIMNLPFPVYIKKIRIRDSYIEYKEKNDKSDSSGKVAFFHVQATLQQVTNMPLYIRQNNLMRLQFNASFLDASPFSAEIRLKLNDRHGIFSMDASLGEINAPALNPLLRPMALAELDKGKINSLRYHLDATNTRGKGKLIIRYENISVKLLKKDDNINKYKTKILPTLAAGFLVKESNPQNGKTRLGDTDYPRDIYRSIFNLMWKSLFAAIKEVVL